MPFRAPTLKRVVAEAGISVLWLTAALFHQVVDEDVPAIAGVKKLLAGGDVLSPSHVRQVIEAAERRPTDQRLWPHRGNDVQCLFRRALVRPRSAIPCRSAGRYRIRRFMFWTRACSRCRPGLRASFTSRAQDWRGAISGAPG